MKMELIVSFLGQVSLAKMQDAKVFVPDST